MLHGLERADRLVELHAFLRVLDRQLQRARRGADAVDDVRNREPVERAADGRVRVGVSAAEASARRAVERHRALLA